MTTDWKAFWLPLLMGAVVLSCKSDPSVGSETHFLRWCSSDNGCTGELSCVCGVCAKTCDDDSICEDLADGAVCVQRSTSSQELSCEPSVMGSCEVSCAVDVDCEHVGSAHRCDRGVCRMLPAECSRGDTDADEVVIIGDLFLAESGEVTAQLEDLARAQGSLGEGDRYRDYSSQVTNPFGEPGDLASQYEAAQAEGSARYVIFNAGGADALLDCPTPVSADCPALMNATAGTRSLLSNFEQTGVEHALLFFYPDPEDTTLAAKFDVLRPMLQDECEGHALPCTFVDLRPTFSGNESEYLLEGGVLPTTVGARATAELIFSRLERECVAQ